MERMAKVEELVKPNLQTDKAVIVLQHNCATLGLLIGIDFSSILAALIRCFCDFTIVYSAPRNTKRMYNVYQRGV